MNLQTRMVAMRIAVLALCGKESARRVESPMQAPSVLCWTKREKGEEEKGGMMDKSEIEG